MTTSELWGFYASADELPVDLTPPHVRQLARMEAAERAEEVERRERIEEHRDRAYNLAIAESMSRAHAAGEAWDPAEPLKHYPTIAERIEQGFAMADAQAARDARAAKRAAAKVLAEHGVTGQVMIDVESSTPGQGLAAGGFVAPPAASRANLKARIRRALTQMPKSTVKDAHPIAGTDGWVPDHRDPDTGEIVRYDVRKFR